MIRPSAETNDPEPPLLNRTADGPQMLGPARRRLEAVPGLELRQRQVVEDPHPLIGMNRCGHHETRQGQYDQNEPKDRSEPHGSGLLQRFRKVGETHRQQAVSWWVAPTLLRSRKISKSFRGRGIRHSVRTPSKGRPGPEHSVSLSSTTIDRQDPRRRMRIPRASSGKTGLGTVEPCGFTQGVNLQGSERKNPMAGTCEQDVRDGIPAEP